MNRSPTEMELRVAEAAYFTVQSGDDHTWAEVMAQAYNRPRDLCLLAARAAIRAMREPTEAMVKEHCSAKDYDAARWHWGAMIDAASPPNE